MRPPLPRLPGSCETGAWEDAGHSPWHSYQSGAGAPRLRPSSQVNPQSWGLRTPTATLGMAPGLEWGPHATAACGRVPLGHYVAYDTGHTWRHAPPDIAHAGAALQRTSGLTSVPRSPHTPQ